jgi:hypothetical protein
MGRSGRWRRRSLFRASVLAVLATTAGRALAQPSFDASALRHYPLKEVTADFALTYIVKLGPQGRGPYLQALATLDPRLRTLILLETLRRWFGRGRDGLHTYFFLHAGDVAPEVLMALRDAHLDREADVMAEALAVFGPVYPAEYAVRRKLFGYDTSPDLNAFDLRLMPIALRFGDRAALARAIEAYVRRMPWLLDRMEQHRPQVPEETRLNWLQLQLARHVDLVGPVAAMTAGFLALPPDYRPILVLGLFEWEFSNGGVHQFFFNSAGNLAPEVLEALEALSLPRQAAAMRKALAMFAEPYERDTGKRRARYFPPGTRPWDKRLESFTYEIEAVEGEPFFTQALLDFARYRDLIPR